jgi:hypothetical protein
VAALQLRIREVTSADLGEFEIRINKLHFDTNGNYTDMRKEDEDNLQELEKI